MPVSQQKLIITLASKNPGKQMELKRWLESGDFPVEIALNEGAEDVEETGSDFIDNAWLKAMRRIGTRRERKPENYLAFLRLGMIVILARSF